MKPPRPWEVAVVEIVQRSGQIKLAAECAGISRDGVYKRIRREPQFAAKVQQAKAEYATSVAASASARFRRVG